MGNCPSHSSDRRYRLKIIQNIKDVIQFKEETISEIVNDIDESMEFGNKKSLRYLKHEVTRHITELKYLEKLKISSSEKYKVRQLIFDFELCLEHLTNGFSRILPRESDVLGDVKLTKWFSSVRSAKYKKLNSNNTESCNYKNFYHSAVANSDINGETMLFFRYVQQKVDNNGLDHLVRLFNGQFKLQGILLRNNILGKSVGRKYSVQEGSITCFNTLLENTKCMSEIGEVQFEGVPKRRNSAWI